MNKKIFTVGIGVEIEFDAEEISENEIEDRLNEFLQEAVKPLKKTNELGFVILDDICVSWMDENEEDDDE